MTFERGETVELETGEYAEVVWDNGQDVDLRLISTGDPIRRSVAELLEING